MGVQVITTGLLVLCGMVGPLRVGAESAQYCRMAVQITRDALAVQSHRPKGQWTVVFTQEYIRDDGRLLRGATQKTHRRIYVVSAEPRTIFHELHHAADAEAERWEESVAHSHWTCKDWREEYMFSGAAPTWTNVCGDVP